MTYRSTRRGGFRSGKFCVTKIQLLITDNTKWPLIIDGKDYLVSGNSYLAGGKDYLVSGNSCLAGGKDYLVSGNSCLAGGKNYLVGRNSYLADNMVPNKKVNS